MTSSLDPGFPPMEMGARWWPWVPDEGAGGYRVARRDPGPPVARWWPGVHQYWYSARMSGLLLRRASVYRPGHWADDDYDVYDGERIVGRIFRAEAGHPAETPWMWTILFHERRPPGPHQGFAVSREEAMVAFKASWERGRS